MYDSVDAIVTNGTGSQPVSYLTGEVELSGKQRGTKWDATLYSQNFIETVLDRIAYGYPTRSS
jgi:hypothetical protein